MKSKTIIEIEGAAARLSAQNIDGFFRARSTTLSPIKAAPTPPNTDRIAVLGGAPPLRPTTKHAGRGTNHARAHTPQPAKTQTIRVQSSATHSQKVNVQRTPVSANHTKAHTTQTSQTLMRSAVKRPEPSFRTQAGTKGSLQHSVPSLIVSKKSVLSLDEQRLVRAKTTLRSPFISHHATAKGSLAPALAPLAVVPQPVKPQEQVPANSPAPMPTNKPTDIFEHALANASHYVDLHAHHKAYRRKVKTHVASMLAGSMVLIAIASFVAYQNSPALQVRVASIRSGVSAHLPDLAALGYSYSGVSAQNGKLTVGLSKGSASYKVTQQATNLSSDDMIQDVGATDASGTPDYTAISAGPTTIYRFGNTTATWVQNGKWYTVSGTGALTDAQLQKLVKNI